MKKFLKEKLKIDIDQPSTKKGIALVGAGVALASGHPELLTATVTDAGVQYGGLIGTVVPLALGLWETLRNEFK
ncbi:TPA: hypothetical protein NGR75_004239 [Vibrio parahaemolyticus]|uniref:hypothetical protein n=1 Tax=Vibrio alginolyticus TaxID=663 RepID=UPI0007AA20A1|nr:hypothetical protein [Vibrio alginolyticus]EGR2568042.1 hypothetical protein [Vibrio parahaemolyticus]EJG1289550.1 hypothetical protein [Vibrio parahaemolyticus]EJG1299349.1 hypothetical protein [Vibrio parahaemolyticus]EJG1332052.1 hypothetical protein [Vibrio parahaemolyticus]KZC46052.1 putative membrane protein [Vibrio alginolyticus]